MYFSLFFRRSKKREETLNRDISDEKYFKQVPVQLLMLMFQKEFLLFSNNIVFRRESLFPFITTG